MAVAAQSSSGERPVESWSQGAFVGQVCNDWRETLIAAGQPRLPEWLASGAARLVKQGTHRDVYEVHVGDRDFFVKRYVGRSWIKALANAWRGSPARREWQHACELARRGVASVVPLAWAEHKIGGLPHDSFFISAAIPQACAVETWLEASRDEAPSACAAARRHHLTRQLAHFVAQVHEAGVWHDDFHLGNILLSETPTTDEEPQEDRFHLIDVPGIHLHRQALAWPASRQALVVLMAGVLARTSRAERWRFWRSYHDARLTPGIDARTAATEITQRAMPYLRAVFRSRDRRAWQNNRDFHGCRVPGLSGQAVRSLSPADVESIANAIRASFDHAKATTNRIDIPLGNRLIRIERFVEQPARWPWRRAARDRASRRWHMGQALASREIAVRRPLCLLRDESAPTARVAYVAVDSAPATLQLDAWLAQSDAAPLPDTIFARRALARELGRLVGRVHRWGISVGSAAIESFAISTTEREPRPILEAYETATICRRVARSRATRELGQLLAATRRVTIVTRTDCLRFLRTYLTEGGYSSADWKSWWQTQRHHEVAATSSTSS